MKISLFSAILLLTVFSFSSCEGQSKPNSKSLMQDVTTLASDEMEGRGTGTEGIRKAKKYIINRYKEIGIEPLGNSYESAFTWGDNQAGVNIVGKITGRSENYIIVTAHYDHEGIRKDQIYNGADDNASGVAGLLAIAEYYAEKKPNNTILFVAFDAEERGLQGAKAFVKELPVPKENVKVNINMDMISRS
ncbi:MAG: M20/M25/M40 family metallo-hydrolase, partial [Cyclobacteriaceae bacterium]